MKYLKRIWCFLFGHVFETEKEVSYIRTGHCKRCKRKMWGAYMRGEITGNMFWVYILGDLKDKHNEGN